MASSPHETVSPSVAPGADGSDSSAVIPRYSTGIWRTLLHRLRIPFLDAKIARPAPPHRRRKPSLPLPLPDSASRTSSATLSRTSVVLQDIIECILHNLHTIQKSLQFWHSQAQGTSGQKIYFMIFERGPRAFVNGIGFNSTFGLLTRPGTNGSTFQHTLHGASDTISPKIAILMSLRRSLAIFYAQMYMELNKYGKLLIEDADKSLPLLLLSINSLFLKLEVSISHSHEIAKDKGLPSLDNSSTSELHFENISHVDLEKSQWTDDEIGDAIDMIYQNLERLDSHLALILSTCQKPKSLKIYWLHYTCGAVGLSLCLLWLLRHSRLMGSSDIDNWIHKAKESAAVFLKDYVGQSFISAGNLFEAFRGRDKGLIQPEGEASESLRRLQLALHEQTERQTLPNNVYDWVSAIISYNHEVNYPLRNFSTGLLARHIQIQKYKQDIETAMLMDWNFKANRIAFDILNAVPAFVLPALLILALLIVKEHLDISAEDRRRVAFLQWRLLLAEAEGGLDNFRIDMDRGKEDEAQYTYGLVLYTLDCLCKAVERPAMETGEWKSLRQEIVDLAKPDLKTDHKLAIASQMLKYHCLESQ